VSDFEELDPHIEDALRAVPPASASMKEAHISAALAESTARQRSTVGLMSNRARSLAAIAVVLVLLLSGVSVFVGGATPNNNVATPDTTMPPKGATDCSQEFAGLWGDVGDSKEMVHNNQTYALMFRDDNIDVYQATPPCSSIGTLGYREALVARDNETSPTSSTSVCSYTSEPVARFSDSAKRDSYKLVLVHTDSGLSLHFEDRCDSPIATLDLP